MIKIRKFEETDINDIINLYKQVSIQHSNARPDIFKKHSHENIIEVVKKVISNKDNMIFVAEENCVIGMLIVKIKEVKEHINLQDSKVLWIDDLIIDAASRKKRNW